jgi:hypothetical protein
LEGGWEIVGKWLKIMTIIKLEIKIYSYY